MSRPGIEGASRQIRSSAHFFTLSGMALQCGFSPVELHEKVCVFRWFQQMEGGFR